MKHYHYIGTDPFLIGMKALGRVVNGVFKVQVDEFDHPWSHYWYDTLQEDWCEIEEK